MTVLTVKSAGQGMDSQDFWSLSMTVQRGSVTVQRSVLWSVPASLIVLDRDP